MNLSIEPIELIELIKPIEQNIGLNCGKPE